LLVDFPHICKVKRKKKGKTGKLKRKEEKRKTPDNESPPPSTTPRTIPITTLQVPFSLLKTTPQLTPSGYPFSDGISFQSLPL